MPLAPIFRAVAGAAAGLAASTPNDNTSGSARTERIDGFMFDSSE